MSDAASILAPNPARLAEIIRAKSFGMGKIIRLASGRESNFYFNMKPTMLDPEGSALIAAAFVEVMTREKPDFIAGLELGAVPPLAEHTPATPGAIRLSIDQGDGRRLAVHGGEIVAIAGVDGNGQTELVHAVLDEAPGTATPEIPVGGRRAGAFPRASASRGHGARLSALRDDRSTGAADGGECETRRGARAAPRP